MKSVLSSSDWEATLTKDPDTFIDNIILTLYKGENNLDKIVASQRLVFKKWLSNYSASLQDKHEIRGAIKALSSLPLKSHKIKPSTVDLKAVTNELKRLKELLNA